MVISMSGAIIAKPIGEPNIILLDVVGSKEDLMDKYQVYRGLSSSYEVKLIEYDDSGISESELETNQEMINHIFSKYFL